MTDHRNITSQWENADMGRKKTIVEQPPLIEEPVVPEVEAESEQKKGWKGEAIRKLAAEHPQLKHVELAALFEKTYGDTISLPAISNALKTKEEKETRLVRSPGLVLPSMNQEVTVSELLRVLKLVEEKESVKEFVKIYQEIEKVVEVAGSFQRLGDILDALSELKG